jgi:hypothetical protein
MSTPWASGPVPPGGVPESSLRIGDADRQRAAEALAEHFATGRLDSEEYDERVGRVWLSKTRGELPPLFDDLPGGTPPELRLTQPPPGATHWVAGPGAFQQPRSTLGAVKQRVSGLPVWAIVLLVVLTIAVVSSAFPFLLAGAIVWFFLAGPGKCSTPRHHGPRRR